MGEARRVDRGSVVSHFFAAHHPTAGRHLPGGFYVAATTIHRRVVVIGHWQLLEAPTDERLL